MTGVSTIRILGPASDKAFLRAGIKTAGEVRAMGADQAYRTLLGTGTKPHFIGYYALVMGLQGRPWNDCQGAEKIALRTRFDNICAAALKNRPPDSAIEAELNRIGVLPKKDAP